MISVLLPCYKSELLLKSVVRQSLLDLDQHTPSGAEIVLYDNGGNGDALRSLSKVNDVKIIGNGENLGLNRALNRCAEAATGDYFFLPHTDMVLDAFCLKALKEQARKLPPLGFLFCSRSIERTKGHTPFHVIEDHGHEDTLALNKLEQSFLKHRQEKSVVTAYRMPFFMHRKLWEKMDGVDENLFSYATDDDLFLSAHHAGVRRFWMINSSLVYHMQGRSNAQQNVDRDCNKPYEYLRNKWTRKGYDMSGNLDQALQRLIPWNVKVQ